MLAVNPLMESPGSSTSTSNFIWKYCRMCALEVKQGVYIFGTEGRKLEIQKKIRKTVSILVLEEDTLPKKICTSCCNSLEAYAQFKDAAVDAQEKLNSIAKSIEKSQEQSLLQIRSKHLLQSPKGRKLYSSFPSAINSHVLLPAPSLVSAEPDLGDPAIEMDEPEPPSSVGSSEDESVVARAHPECSASFETPGRDDEINCHETLQGPCPSGVSSLVKPQGLVTQASSSVDVNVQVQPQQTESCKNNSLPFPNSPGVSSDGDVESESNELEAHLVCGLCVAPVVDKNLLEAHNHKSHPMEEEPLFGCSACPRVSTNYEAIRQHIYRHRMTGAFKCADCEKSFSTKGQLHFHVTSKHNPTGNKSFSCNMCENKYSTSIALAAHERKKHRIVLENQGSIESLPSGSDRSNKLSNIVESVNLIKEMNQSIIIPSVMIDRRGPTNGQKDPPTVLVFSGSKEDTATAGTAATESNLSSVRDSHSRSDEDVAVKSSQSSHQNQNQSTENESGNSKICTDGQKSQEDTPENGKGHWQCGYCDKILYSKCGYDTHVAVHKGRRFTCEYCGAAYKQKFTLDNHIKVHHTNIEKEFECPECKKRFKTFRHLAVHKKTHDRPLTGVSCPLCEKKFLNMISLKTHMKLHRGSKKFVCVECPKKFCTKLKLEDHMNSHTGRRPYGCPIENCSKVFSCFSNYAKHFKKNHPEQLGPRGSLVPQPKIVEDNNNVPTNLLPPKHKEPHKIKNKPLPHSNGTNTTSILVTSATSTETHSGKIQQTGINACSSQGKTSELTQTVSPSQTASESPPSSNPLTVIQVPFSTHLSSTAISNRSLGHLSTGPHHGTISSGTSSSTGTSMQHNISSSTAPASISQIIHSNMPHGQVTTISTSSNDNNVNQAHSQCSSSNNSHSHLASGHGAHIAHSNNSHGTISTHTQTTGLQSHHSVNQFPLQQPQPHNSSVWQPVILPSSKTYSHPSTTSGLATINGLDLMDCAGTITAAHTSEPMHHPNNNHGQHQQGNFNSIHMPVTAAHNSTMSHAATSHGHHHGPNFQSSSGSSGHSSIHQGGINLHSSSTLHIPHPTPSAHSSIPLSSSTVTVPSFVPSSQQSEPMELSYKLESSNFQDMPMELTKVFHQRDPLELCVRQEFAAPTQPLMDLSSRVVNVTVGGNPPMNNVSSVSMNLNGSGSNSSQSQNHYGSTGSGTSTTTVLSIPYHKNTEMLERELSLNDFTGAFRQPIDLILARSDDHSHSHELCSEGNLVDLSLRSSFGQDQSASSFLRELIDLSSRSDSFHGEVNLTNKQQQTAPGAHSQSQLHHHSHTSASKPSNPSVPHHSHHGIHHHHHHHHVQGSSHQSSNSAVGLPNVIYHDTMFNLQN